MKLSTRSRYGTRLMLELALFYGRGPMLLKDIARSEDISEKYLSQIIIPLKSKGLVNSQRGAYGGYILAKAPEEITVLDIVETLEGDLNIVDCLDENENCSRASQCVTSGVWKKLQNEIFKVLESVTLKELADQARDKDQQAVMYNI